MWGGKWSGKLWSRCGEWSVESRVGSVEYGAWRCGDWSVESGEESDVESGIDGGEWRVDGVKLRLKRSLESKE